MAVGSRILSSLWGVVGRRPRAFVFLGVLAVLVAAWPLWGGFLGARVVASVLSRRLGVPVSVGHGWADWRKLRLDEVVVDGEGARDPLLSAASIEIPFGAVWGQGQVSLQAPRLHIERGGAGDNASAILSRLAGRGDAEGGQATVRSTARKLPEIVVAAGTLTLRDVVSGLSVLVGVVDATVAPGSQISARLRQVSGTLRLRGNDKDPAFGAGAVDVDVALLGLRPATYPRVRVEEGYLQVLPTLPLTGINGTVAPTGSDRRVSIDLSGSYAGAKRALWTATGTVRPRVGQSPLEGALSLRAEKFTLDKVADVLPAYVLRPQEASVNAALELNLGAGGAGFNGNLEVAGLSLRHDALASEPLESLSFGLRAEGTVEPGRRRLDITKMTAQLRHLTANLSGSIELAPGTFHPKEGPDLAMLPRIDLTLRVPRLPCAKLLSSIPAPVVPHLSGFVLDGFFEADIKTKIDYANLDALELTGKVGIDGCRVLGAPDEVNALAGPAAIVQIVEIPAAPPSEPGATEMMAFALGPEGPDFVPYERISQHLINAIMTTEDSGFFKHRGWVSSEFKSALRRNLAGGGFRLGASSITMQMVKNVVLSREKTLSRKLQELFLVWYIEKQLPKERILELYFNAIEFGPRIYGIGAAARHYFGKTASELTPLEAAFFSSMLPSPKRRYIQYCHGALYPPWDKYVRRILAKVYERGRLTPEEYAAASASPLVFNLDARAGGEKPCLDWIKQITLRPEPEPPTDVENP